MASPLSLFAYLQIKWNGKTVFVFKAFILENKTRKTKVVKLHLISGEPVSIIKHIIKIPFYTEPRWLRGLIERKTWRS
jgi:hypothetical protein